MANEQLHIAKNAKNNEFYTQLSDIQSELSNYKDKFRDKTVFCNCDDPFESNFVKYFLMNFNRLGLKTLIATGYKTSPIGGAELGEANAPYVLRVTDTNKYLVGTQKDLNIRGAKHFLETEGSRVMTPLVGNPALDKDGKPIQISFKETYVDDKGKIRKRNVLQDLYYEPGDFRSDMSLELLKEADIVVTNPPFSLFREYLAQLVEYKKQFLIIANKCSISYKEIFPLIKNDEIWVGCSPMGVDMLFDVPPYYAEWLVENKKKGSGYKTVDGVIKGRAQAFWFTNLDHAKRHQMFPLDLGHTYYGHEDMYPKYDNYDAIDIGKNTDNGKRQGDINMIPCDYDGVMGVPITFLDKYCPEQFEIVKFRKGDDDKDLSVNGQCPFFRILIRRRK